VAAANGSLTERGSAIELGFPHDFLNRPMTRQVMFGEIRLDAAS
jgi:hypothetical protein